MNSDTLIIIIIFASLGLLVLVFALSKLYRSLSATSNPLPPVQPLAHHRQTYYQLHHFQANNSKASLLDEEYILVDPQPLFHHQSRPSSSCSTSNTSTPSGSLRTMQKTRPTSVASSSRLSRSPSLSSGRRGLPHSVHSQMHVVLPAPLSGSPSDSSLVATSEFGNVNLTTTPRRPSSFSRPSSRHFLDVSSEHDRRSMSFVDRWLPTPSTDSYSLGTDYADAPMPPPTQHRIPSPLIPSSSSSLSQAHSHHRKSIATTLRNPSPSPSNTYSNTHSNISINVDPGTDTGSISRPTTSYSSISIVLDSSNVDADKNPMPMPIPIVPTAVTADIPPIQADSIPIPIPSSSDSNVDTNDTDTNSHVVDIVDTIPPSLEV